MMTKQQTLCNKLRELDFKEAKYPTTKYRVFARPGHGYYFVGKNGALRTGQTVTDSIPTMLPRAK